MIFRRGGSLSPNGGLNILLGKETLSTRVHIATLCASRRKTKISICWRRGSNSVNHI